MSQQQPPRFSPEQLNGMLQEHLSFEINRFKYGAEIFGNNKFGRVPDAMIREACLIHARVLVDFFYPRNNIRKDDVIVTDYLPGWAVNKPDWVEDYRTQVDWQLAHLTMNRVPMPPWTKDHLMHIKGLIDQFLRDLPVDMRQHYDPAQGL